MKSKKSNTKNHVSTHRKAPSSYNVQVAKLPISESTKKLQSAGIDVTEEEAEEIMEFLYMFAEVMLKEFVSKSDFS